MVEVFQDLQTLLDDVMGFSALNIGHEADTAGVMLLRGVVQPVSGESFDFLSRGGRWYSRGHRQSHESEGFPRVSTEADQGSSANKWGQSQFSRLEMKADFN
jgi:hypothetical protein